MADIRTNQDPNDANLFLRKQGLMTVMAVVSFVVFYYFSNAYVVVSCVLGMSGLAKLLDRNNNKNTMIPTKNRAVLITGCDTGFGKELALKLSSMGVTLFAACSWMSSEGATTLRKLKNPDVHLVQMDVTKPDEIKEIAKTVKRTVGEDGLWGVVNAASVNFLGDVELMTTEQYERVMTVNQLGLVRVTKAFLPLIRNSKGRIINVSSAKGRVPRIYQSAYDMTMGAIEAFSDVLRMEMRKFGVTVVIIEPCNLENVSENLELDCFEAEVQSMWNTMSPELRHIYGKEYVLHHAKAAKNAAHKLDNNIPRTVDKMIDALFISQPKARYLVAESDRWYSKQKWRVWLNKFAPSWFMDGLFIHDTRDYPNPRSLIGKHHH